MKFILGIKPTILTGYGTTKDAFTRFRNSVRGCWTSSTQFGTAYTDGFGTSRYPTQYVYGYNIEVFKRGKHRKNKHYVVYRYSFPVEMFKLLNVEIHQGNRTFKITPKKR